MFSMGLKLVSQTEKVCVPEQDAEENIRTSFGGDNQELHDLHLYTSLKN